MTSFPQYQPPVQSRPEAAGYGDGVVQPSPAAVPAPVPVWGSPYAQSAGPYAAEATPYPGRNAVPDARSLRRAQRHAATMARTGGQSTAGAAFAHFSFFFSWIIGSLVMYTAARPGSYQRRQAARAFNWQVLATGILILSGLVFDNGLHWGSASDLVGLAVVLLTVLGGVRALQGHDWVNPLVEKAGIRVLKEDR